jgi:hypothetical protein
LAHPDGCQWKVSPSNASEELKGLYWEAVTAVAATISELLPAVESSALVYRTPTHDAEACRLHANAPNLGLLRSQVASGCVDACWAVEAFVHGQDANLPQWTAASAALDRLRRLAALSAQAEAAT